MFQEDVPELTWAQLPPMMVQEVRAETPPTPPALPANVPTPRSPRSQVASPRRAESERSPRRAESDRSPWRRMPSVDMEVPSGSESEEVEHMALEQEKMESGTEDLESDSCGSQCGSQSGSTPEVRDDSAVYNALLVERELGAATPQKPRGHWLELQEWRISHRMRLNQMRYDELPHPRQVGGPARHSEAFG